MISLLSEFLKLDWRKRITAVDALKHPYFTTPPLPARPGDLPQFEDSHELDRRQYRQKPKPPAPPNGAAGESDWSTGTGARAAAGQSSRVPAGVQRGGPAPRGDFRRAPDVRPSSPLSVQFSASKLIYDRTASHQNLPLYHSQDGQIVKTTTVPLTAATAVAMEDDPIHTSPDTTDTTTLTITTIVITTETAIITSTAALVRVTAGRRIASTVTEVIILIPAMPDDEVKVRR